MNYLESKVNNHCTHCIIQRMEHVRTVDFITFSFPPLSLFFHLPYYCSTRRKCISLLDGSNAHCRGVIIHFGGNARNTSSRHHVAKSRSMITVVQRSLYYENRMWTRISQNQHQKHESQYCVTEYEQRCLNIRIVSEMSDASYTEPLYAWVITSSIAEV